MDPSVDYQKENSGLEVNSSLFSTSEASGVSFPDFFDDHSIDSLDQFVFNANLNTNHTNGYTNGYQLATNSSADNSLIDSGNQLNREKITDEEMNESTGCDVPFEYVIHEQQNDG